MSLINQGGVMVKRVQVPLEPDYVKRLEERASAADRVVGREGSRIIKDVLDGRYVWKGDGHESGRTK